jgi:hypothetical protein
MTDKTQAMDRSRSGGQPVLLPCEYCATDPVHFENAYGTGYIIHCPEDENCMVSPYVEMGTKEQSIAAWNARQPTQTDALKIAREALEGLIDHCVEQERVITEEMHHMDYCGESAPICAARAALEQSPFAQSIPSLHIHLQKTQINRPSNLHKTQIAKPERPDMTDAVSKQSVIDAIAGERLNEDTGSEGDAAYERALDDVLEAINAIPAVTVTDEMVERAAMTHWNIGPELAWGELDQHDRDFLIKGMRTALVAAFGE